MKTERSLLQKPRFHHPEFRRWVLVLFLVLGIPGILLSFPPAPHHVIFGQVRDEMGEPISFAGAQVILETTNAVPLLAGVGNSLEPGVNYELRVPMDAGITPKPYTATALTSSVPFRLEVTIGSTVYLPIEMIGNLTTLGEPAKKTRIDLTLGVDSDGDGLPDAWEQALIDALGGGLTLQSITPGGDPDGDGLTNLQEYLAGTNPYDPANGFQLTLIQVDENASFLEFLAVRGRTYSIFSSTNLQDWTPAAFSIPSEGPGAPLRNNYVSPTVRILEVEVPHVTGLESNLYFKALVQ